MSNWEDKLQEFKTMVNLALEHYLPTECKYPETIHRAVRYSVFNGGKRLRPILVLGAAEAVGGSASAVMPAACALELLHTYSLIHDDLPAMDNDDYRRGRPTNHKVFGEAIAILAGDALLTRAFELVAENRETAPESAVLDCIGEISRHAGTEGMIGGQAVDILSQGETVGRETIEYMHTKKTGSLFRAALRCGGILTGADKTALAALTTYAEKFGLAFQIIDDILDIKGDESLLGKPVGSDLRNRKSTYPSIYGVEESSKMAGEAVAEAIGALKVFGDKGDFLKGLAQYIIDREC